MKEFLLLNKDAKSIAIDGDPVSFRAFLKNIGSNFLLKGKRLGFERRIGWERAAEWPHYSMWWKLLNAARLPRTWRVTRAMVRGTYFSGEAGSASGGEGQF